MTERGGLWRPQQSTNHIKNDVILINNFNYSFSSTYRCDGVSIHPILFALAGTEALSPIITAESAAPRHVTPEGEHRTPINNNNTIVQTAIIYEKTNRGERVGGIEICGCDIKCSS